MPPLYLAGRSRRTNHRTHVRRAAAPIARAREREINAGKHLAHIHLAPPSAAFGRRYHRLDNQPFGIAEIARVTKAGAIGGTAVFRFPHRALPSRIKRLTRNHIRFIRLKKFSDRLLGSRARS
jgi:hypothetical protein